MSGRFTAGGLASGLDTNALIDAMVAAQNVAIAKVNARRSAFVAKVSAFGDLANRLSAVANAAKTLAASGVRQVKVNSTNTAFAATTTSASGAGTYDVSVHQLATAAKLRSGPLSGAGATIAAGTLAISVQGGEPVEVAIEEGDKLADVVRKINESGAAVSASIVSDGTHSYLSLTNRMTGHPVGGDANEALVVSQDFTGGDGSMLFAPSPEDEPGAATARAAATNAVVYVDGLRVESATNSITNAVPGTTLELKAPSHLVDGERGSETLVLGEDSASTQERLKGLVNAWNSLMALIKTKAYPGAGMSGDLSGESLVRSLQTDLQGVLTEVFPGSTLQTLGDIGIKIERDGTLLIDTATFDKAFEQDPTAIDNLFSNGLADSFKNVVDRYTNSRDGFLVQRREGLNLVAKRMQDDIERMQGRTERLREQLIRQFTALEDMISRYQGITNFLDAQDLARRMQAAK